MNSAFVTIYGIFIYLTGLVIGFKFGREYERDKNRKKWDQDAH